LQSVPVTTRCIVLDFGNVIAFFDHRKACRRLAGLSNASMDTEDVYDAIFQTPLEADYDVGRISTAQFLEVLRSTVRLQATDAEIERAWCDIFTPNDAMATTIQALKARRLRLVLASNTNALHHDWFARVFAETLSVFDAQVLSYQVGSRKPERPFFDACLAAAGCSAPECLYVDDRRDFVAAGQHAGMTGLVYTPEVDVVAAVCY
jgi:glucose-1-phosphatase